VETTAPTVSHTFPSAGAYTVALTVFAGDGTSIGTAKSVATGGVAPVVTRVAPAKGPVGGGTSVNITGQNLGAAKSVKFGSTAAASFAIISATKITATAPAHVAGIVDVTVTSAVGTSEIVKADHYKYVPTVTSVSPTSGPAAGGTSVTITGTGFAVGSGTTIIKFGAAKSLSVSCQATTTCTAVSPKHLTGTFDVLATVNAATSVKSPPGDQFTYF
jgi:hypothetical protein